MTAAPVTDIASVQVLESALAALTLSQLASMGRPTSGPDKPTPRFIRVEGDMFYYETYGRHFQMKDRSKLQSLQMSGGPNTSARVNKYRDLLRRNVVLSRKTVAKNAVRRLAELFAAGGTLDDIKVPDDPAPATTRGEWNGLPVHAVKGSVIVGKSPAPTWWCAGMEGTRVECVRVGEGNDVFFIDDSDGSGSLKVFERGGGPDSHHRSIPVDAPASFIEHNACNEPEASDTTPAAE